MKYWLRYIDPIFWLISSEQREKLVITVNSTNEKMKKIHGTKNQSVNHVFPGSKHTIRQCTWLMNWFMRIFTQYQLNISSNMKGHWLWIPSIQINFYDINMLKLENPCIIFFYLDFSFIFPVVNGNKSAIRIARRHVIRTCIEIDVMNKIRWNEIIFMHPAYATRFIQLCFLFWFKIISSFCKVFLASSMFQFQ